MKGFASVCIFLSFVAIPSMVSFQFDIQQKMELVKVKAAFLRQLLAFSQSENHRNISKTLSSCIVISGEGG